MTQPIIKTLVVNVTADKAFDVFVNRIANWWPLDSHAVSASHGKSALAVTVEPKVNGAIYEALFDGSRADWGRVLEFLPGQRFAMTWHPGSDADRSTRVEVVFEKQGLDRTLVTLTHSGWEIWASEATEKRGNYDRGWDHVLERCFAGAVDE